MARVDIKKNTWNDEANTEADTHSKETEFHLDGLCDPDFLASLSDRGVLDKEAGDWTTV